MLQQAGNRDKNIKQKEGNPNVAAIFQQEGQIPPNLKILLCTEKQNC